MRLWFHRRCRRSSINDHAMTTRGKHGIRKAPDRLNLHVDTLSLLPRMYRAALADPHWRSAMEEEFSALLATCTWELVPRPPNINVVTGKWIFKHKLQADGSLDRYKAWWVLRGFKQRPGVDFDETFSPVVKPSTVRTASPGGFCVAPSITGCQERFDGTLQRRFIVIQPPLATPPTPTWCAGSTSHCTASSKHLACGTVGSPHS